MLKNLHSNALFYILSLFNAILSHNTYLHYWKAVIIIIFFLKPNANPLLLLFHHQIPYLAFFRNYFKKLNKRLLWFIESNSLLSSVQYGFRKGRNTTQPLLDFQIEINKAALHKSALYLVLFYLRKAFPRVWRHYITLKLHKFGLRDKVFSTVEHWD